MQRHHTKEVQNIQVILHVRVEHVPVGQNILDLGIVGQLVSILQYSLVIHEKSN